MHTWLRTNKELATDAWKVHDDLLNAMRGAHASTVRASVRREGEWPNLDYSHHLGFGARKIAVALIERRLEAFRAVADNLLSDADLSDAHEFIRQAVAILESEVEELLKKIQLVGREAFATQLKAAPSLWEDCIAEWGQGAGYRVRVTSHNQLWFDDESKKARHEFVKEMIVKEWDRITNTLEPLLEVGAATVE